MPTAGMIGQQKTVQTRTKTWRGVNGVNCKPNANLRPRTGCFSYDACGSFKLTVSVRSHDSNALTTAEAVILRGRIRGYVGVETERNWDVAGWTAQREE
jgi:hypothetical protein